ncbi:uncharacterized protein LOC106867862 isoform X1 [Octopus bimaculoides]|uniref:uncharacterized protein LOC106867862 isoform X1 n=1 Tax=Octopus bimaculoides TaxID=37653 RepID=UPI00071DCF6F|nr:uncharacterized protein LOC106867862 isoform X1 [Octopus bimaculoides]|eukprot:XP_014768392.1 PREDICTED: uncharacterized protein LOC106867862 isoform X1 [Octopus bimaculoides]
MDEEKKGDVLLGVLLLLFTFGLPTVVASDCAKHNQSLDIAARISENGSDINCGDKHVIFISDVQADGILLEPVQEHCGTNHTCDITQVYGESYVEYYCVDESLILGCEEITSKHKVVKEDFDVRCYKYTQHKFKDSIYPCGIIPNKFANNRWLILQSQRVHVKTCKDCDTDMHPYYQYNIPNKNIADGDYLQTIFYDCDKVIWFLHVNSDDCEGIFKEFFLKTNSGNPKFNENEAVEENITGSYPTEVETISHYVDTTSFLPSQEVSSLPGFYNVDKRMFPREIVNYLTIGIAGGLTLITLTVCFIVILRRPKQKSVAAPPSSATGLYGCTHLPENFDAASPEEENTYFTVEADDEIIQKKVEENTYNCIDEVKGSNQDPVVERYSKLRSPRTVLEKIPSLTIKDNYDQIVEEMVQGRMNSTCPRMKKVKPNGSLRKTGSLHRQASKDSTAKPGSQEVNEAIVYKEVPCYQCSSLSPEYFDRALPSAPLMESDSASEPDAIYERVDDLLTSDQDRNNSQVNDIYETVTEPNELKSQYSTFQRQTDGNVGENNSQNNSLKLDNKPAIANGNLQPPRIYDHICDKWNNTDKPLHLIPSDEYVYTQLQDDTTLGS